MKESDLVKKILRVLREEGGFWIKIHGGPSQVTGIPDIIGCYKGNFIGFEVKVPGRMRTSPRQRLILKRIRQAGGYAGVVTTPEACLEMLARVQ